MSDFDMGYYYFEHDKAEEENDLKTSGTMLTTSGILVLVASSVFFMFTKRTELTVLSIIGILMVTVGVQRHSKAEEVQKAHISSGHSYHVELHHEPPSILKPSILRHALSRKFSDQVSSHTKEREKIAEIIKQNSGSRINEVYKIYKKEGGKLEPEPFVHAVHSLKNHGIVKITKIHYSESLSNPRGL